jgi:hypothetical protein
MNAEVIPTLRKNFICIYMESNKKEIAGNMVSSCEHGNKPSGSIKADNFLTISMTIRFSRTQLHGISY